MHVGVLKQIIQWIQVMIKLAIREACERSSETNNAVREKSRINRGIAMPSKNKSHFRQS